MSAAILICHPHSVANNPGPHPLWQEEAAAQTAAGLFTATIAEDGSLHGQPPPGGAEVLLRCAPMPLSQYQKISESLSSQGLRVVTSAQEYQRAQSLPGWIATMANHVPETRVVPATHLARLSEIAKRLEWWPLSIRSYAPGAEGVSTAARDDSELTAQWQALGMAADGSGGGVALQRYERMDPASVCRFFVWHQNVWPHPSAPEDAVALARAVTRNFWHLFYAIDIGQRIDGRWRVLQVSDGQVASRREWPADLFANFLRLSFSPHST